MEMFYFPGPADVRLSLSFSLSQLSRNHLSTLLKIPTANLIEDTAITTITTYLSVFRKPVDMHIIRHRRRFSRPTAHFPVGVPCP